MGSMGHQKLQVINTFFEDQIEEVLYIIEVIQWVAMAITVPGHPMVK